MHIVCINNTIFIIIHIMSIYDVSFKAILLLSILNPFQLSYDHL